MFERFKFTDKEKAEIVDSIVIVIDTREKKNEHIRRVFDDKNVPYVSKKLEYGDYSFYLKANPELGIPKDLWFDKEIIIERKGSLEELSGNLTKERARFEKELALAPSHKFLLIEDSTYRDIAKHNYDTEFNPKSFLASLHAFGFRYDMPFIFLPKTVSALFIKKTFEAYLKELLR